MKILYWRTLTLIVILIAVGSFPLLFRLKQVDPYLFSLPYIFWIGILQTALLVICTYLGARLFPFNENRNQ